MTDHCAYIGIGSNLEPEFHVSKALDRLSQLATVDAVSTFFRTSAIDRPGHPDFLNGVVRIWTSLDARRLKRDVLSAIEEELGRVRTADRYADRTVDLDILLFDKMVIEEVGLCVPDPDICQRAFLAAGLLELDPELVLPGTNRMLSELVDACACSVLVPDVNFTNHLRERLTR